jgi:hypothetical protein
MENTQKYTRLRELAAEIEFNVQLLTVGKLSTTELETLTEQTRELFERLVVLRYMAYDESVNGSSKTAAVVQEHVVTEATITPSAEAVREEAKWEPTNQVSLIDAIEEVTKSEPVAPLFSFQPELRDEPVISNTLFDLAALPATESVNEMLAKAMGSRETLAEKLEHKPIADLKEAISLNQRFQFSRELFKGNNQDYEIAIDHLNRTTREDALLHVEVLRAKYSWNIESAVAHDFMLLIERRHQ